MVKALMTTKQSCRDCGTDVQDDPNLLYCPVYHGRYDDGFCPIGADGQTLLETADNFYGCFLRETREVDALRSELRNLKQRGLLARVFNRR